MQVPEGYAELDFVGFTDKGLYSGTEVYMQNDLVHYKNALWRCLADDTTGTEPEEGFTWEIFIEGNKPYYGTYDTFPRPPLLEDMDKFFVDRETDPRLMYTWSEEAQDYILTGGAGGADGGSVDIPINIPGAGWTGDTAPYSQTLTVPQMREGMTPLYVLDASYVNSGNVDYLQYAYSLITGYTAGYAEITFYAADLLDRDVPIILKGIPGQKFETVDNTIIFLVEPDQFTLNPDADNRYQATITVEGMTEGDGGIWDIVRSGAVLSLEESKIAANITDVNRLDGAVRITCLEIPAQRYMMKISGVDTGAEAGSVIVAGMQEWFDRVETTEDQVDGILNPKNYTFSPIMEGLEINRAFKNDCLINYPAFAKGISDALTNTMVVGGITFYIIGKIDKANPLGFSSNQRTSVQYILLQRRADGSGYDTTMATISIYYDGVDTYLMGTTALLIPSKYSTYYFYPLSPLFFNSRQDKK